MLGRIGSIKMNDHVIKGVQSRSIDYSCEFADRTTQTHGAHRTFEKVPTIRQIAMTIDGLVEDSWLNNFMGGIDSKRVAVAYDNGFSVIAGTFNITNYGLTADDRESVAWSLSLESTGGYSISNSPTRPDNIPGKHGDGSGGDGGGGDGGSGDGELDATDATHFETWGPAHGPYTYTDGVGWTNDPNDFGQIYGLAPIGTWADGYRPTTLTLVVNAGADEQNFGFIQNNRFTLFDTSGNELAEEIIDFTAYNEEQTILFTINNAADLDIGRLEVNSFLYNTGPIIQSIVFS